MSEDLAMLIRRSGAEAPKASAPAPEEVPAELGLGDMRLVPPACGMVRERGAEFESTMRRFFSGSDFSSL
jgi:hypothetical protein